MSGPIPPSLGDSEGLAWQLAMILAAFVMGVCFLGWWLYAIHGVTGVLVVVALCAAFYQLTVWIFRALKRFDLI